MNKEPLPRTPDGFRQRGAEVTRLEAFVDAAFAFAVTLLVISVDAIPDTREHLVQALKGIPSFAVSFAMVAYFWHGHARFTRRYGLDDMPSIIMSLVLVFLVLVFVYPLKVMFAGFFQWTSNGYLPANFVLETGQDWAYVFIVFGLAFASMGATLALLTRHAWKRRDELGLDFEERIATRCAEFSWWLIPLMSTVSIAIALLALVRPELPWLRAFPGSIYSLLGFQRPLIAWYAGRLRTRSTKAHP